MKHTVILLLFFSVVGFAQDSTKVKVETPKIISQLPLGESVTCDAVTVTFVEVVNDSRCPKGVQCVWAGEVAVLVDVFKNGHKMERKKLTFGASGTVNDIYVSEKLTISGINVIPYPVNKEKITLKNYTLQLDIRD